LIALTIERGADGTKTAMRGDINALEMVRGCVDDDHNYDETIAVLRLM
jgi:hypothetical protein